VNAKFLQKLCGLIFIAFLAPFLLCPASAQSSRPFLHPDRIRYDSQCLTIDGKDVFIYSGAFHYFRCPKELWHDRFQKIKEAGFNAVETYVPWNWCERQMPAGLDDFSKVDLKDFDDWLTMAEQFGFYIIVRPGPYICAEWDTGGYPQWLLTKKPANPLRSEEWLRTDDPVYLAWSKHWYDAVCPVIARHQITRKAPGQSGVILVQLENEYDFPNLPDDVKMNQVKALAQYARADGIDVPFITCWTHVVRGSTDPILRQAFDCCNFYPRWGVQDTLNDVEKLRREQPDAPLATTELQGGWFSNVGGQLSQDQDGLTGAQINNLTLFMIQNGETMLNYYMLFGGTNPDDWAARSVTTTYDYAAPLREWGGVGERYQRVWAIGHMLQEHGVSLARSSVVNSHVTTTQADVAVVERRAPDGSRYFFVRNSQHDEPRQGRATVQENDGSPELTFNYDLEPFGLKILYLPSGVTDVNKGEWLPKPASPIERPASLPAGVTITSAKMCADPGPAHWSKLKSGEALAQAGVYDSHFIFYRAKISSPGETNLLVDFPSGDAVLPEINGKLLSQAGGRGESRAFALPAGKNVVQFLYENHGHANGGLDMENACGITALSLTGSRFRHGTSITGWRMQIVNGTDNRPEVEPAFNDAGWSQVSVDNLEANQLTPNQDAVFRAGLDLTAADLSSAKTTLSFGRIDDLGWVYVNGALVGRTTDWSRQYSFDATKALRPGHNIIAVVVQNVGGNGGLGLPALGVASGNRSLPLKSFGRPTGDDKQWWKPDLNDAAWTPITIGDSSASTGSVLTWYRMNFSLPSPQSGVWVPWRLHIVASGNGFLYLNGHPLGRYWNAGPQHDFFLPECWLHFGEGQPNNLTLNLRPTDGPAAIQSATVEPYSDFAENR
jgi:hypothetical protein